MGLVIICSKTLVELEVEESLAGYAGGLTLAEETKGSTAQVV